MKKIILTLSLILAVISCNNDKKSADNIATETSQNTTNKIDTLSEIASEGKVVFLQNGKTIIYFDHEKQSGKIKIDGKEYPLNQLIFSENNYELQGEGIRIEAFEGEFKESEKCVALSFPTIHIQLKDKEIHLNDNLEVSDCF